MEEMTEKTSVTSETTVNTMTAEEAAAEAERLKKLEAEKKKLRNIIIGIAVVGVICVILCIAAFLFEKEPEETSAPETTALQQQTVSADDPAVAELENMTVPAVPSVEKMGTIKLPDLKTLEVEIPVMTEVDDKMIEAQIDYLLKQFMEESSEASALGDVVNIDYTGSIDGKVFEGGTAQGYDLELGSHSFIDTFEDQLVGHKPGDKVAVKVTFPENYGSEELKGKKADFDVTVNKVSKKAALSVEWIKKNKEAIGSKADTVEMFREEQKKLLEAQVNYQYETALHQKELQVLTEEAEITLSDEMKAYAEAYVINQEVGQIKNYGVDLATMLNMYGYTVETFKAQLKRSAEEYAKQRIIMDTIASEQKITATAEMKEELAKELSALSGNEMTVDILNQTYGEEVVSEEVVNDAVFDYITSQVQIIETLS